MKELVIGNTTLEYSVKVSHKTKQKRIEITPDRIEVIVPRGTPPEAITDFIEKKKNNIFISFLEIENKLKKIKEYEPTQYISGVKVLYCGRMELLHVEKSAIDEVEITHRNGFYILYPDSIPDIKKDKVIKQSLDMWMKKKIETDVKLLVKTYGEKLNLIPEGIRIKEQKHLWASCGKDRIININWQLVRFPKQILEYVVIHELCHLKHRNHSKDFWMLVGSLMPEYEQYKRMLDKYGDYRV
jgi:predicted metal-dependent hydrolase